MLEPSIILQIDTKSFSSTKKKKKTFFERFFYKPWRGTSINGSLRPKAIKVAREGCMLPN